MIKDKFKLLLVVGVIFALAIFFYIGGLVGFNRGTAAMEYIKGTDAFYTATILERIREGQDDRAILLLEGKLDSQIFSVGYFDKYKKSIFYPAGYKEIDGAEKSIHYLMSKVTAYRKKYPSTSEQGETTKIITETLKKYDE